jgi:uncharacterized SAM-binding protein YcdF (DUF218 family)
MLKNECIICISSIDWDFVWQGHQEIMSTFAKQGNKVLFIENTGVRNLKVRDLSRIKKRMSAWLHSIKGFRQESDKLYIYSPVILPFPYSRIARFINRRLLIGALRRWMHVMDFHNPIIWTFLPTGMTLDICNAIDYKLLVYYCIADFTELSDKPDKVIMTERELIRQCDLIFAQGEVLAKKCSADNANVSIFPFGVSLEVFEKEVPGGAHVPADIRDLKKPVIGYVGGLHKHMDFALIRSAALKNPHWSFVFVGPHQADVSAISGIPNVFLLGQKDFSLLPSYIGHFDIGIIPYLLNDYTKTVYPTKLNEYHIMGIPVVSTRLPDVTKYNEENGGLVYIADNEAGFSEAIIRALTATSGDLVQKRKAAARKAGWSSRIAQMSGLMQAAIDRKGSSSAGWQEKFKKIYRSARINILKAAFIFGALYYATFYTPLIWLMAEPLKIAQQPRKSDCILVFAGGVGESGKAGIGYEERVKWAADLYQQGYGAHIILSSGYTHMFNETSVMKALAVSLGVPEGAILTENNAKNTYENVIFSAAMLKEKGWHKIILVSSPYHMRRASQVFNKIAPDIGVCYAEMPANYILFYAHPARDVRGNRSLRAITMGQISGIAHEYCAIVYYSIKGWL